MGIAIRCILDRKPPECPKMEGKSLAAAWCGQIRPDDSAPAESTGNVLTLDFGGTKPQAPAPPPESAAESLLASLDDFIVGDRGIEWHDTSDGLAAVGQILERLRQGAMVSVAPDFEFFDGDTEDLTNGVTYDLEKLAEILVAAQQVGARFCLAFDV